MKVFFFVKKLGDGGAERVVANLATSFSLAGHETAIINAYRTEYDYPVGEGVKRFFLEKSNLENDNFVKRNIRRLSKLRKILKEERPDVLISFMAESNYRAVTAAAGLGIKTIISVRNDPEREYHGKLGHFLAKHLLTRADGCVFQTPDAQSWFPKSFAERSTVIANVVREDFFSVERKPVPFTVSACGRLTEQKDYGTLLEAFKTVHENLPQSRLEIYGMGEEEEKLKKKAELLSLSDCVSFCGQVSDVGEVLSKTAVYVLSSLYEGLPNSLMEALAAGVPSVSTDCPCGGPRMLIENNKNGILVPVGDSTALAKAMTELLENPETAEKMGKEARNRALEFKTEPIVKKWEEYAKKVLEG
ncbi:MAG: glycosyltransferase [Sphaerochaetaceae bacterium]|nr:glycosyltransferase [Sphaerochaetaceae bacterium]